MFFHLNKQSDYFICMGTKEYDYTIFFYQDVLKQIKRPDGQTIP